MGYPYVAEGGAMPMIISGGDNGSSKDSFMSGGGGIFVILLFFILFAVGAIALMNRREPVVNSTSPVAEFLPAMMTMLTTNARQSTVVDSYNQNSVNPACPTTFDIYKQGVSTNDNVFVQSAKNQEVTKDTACETQKLVIAENAKTRDLINANYIKSLERQNDEQARLLIQKDNQLITTAQFGALQNQITALAGVVCKEPTNARVVEPYCPPRVQTVNDCYNPVAC